MRSVAKHSYVKGASGKAKAMAHVNYIQYRRGDDREDGKPREFFSSDKDGIQGREVKQDLEKAPRSMVVAHKIILSPGLQGVDMKAYARDVLQETGREKGLDLDWRAVIHKNTDHDHSHIIVYGRDKNGRQVKFDKRDYQKMREAGDRYLERNHYYERFMHRDMDRQLKTGTERERGDNLFERLIKDLNSNEPEREKGQKRELEPDKKPEQKKYEPKQWSKEQAIERLPDTEKLHGKDQIYTKYSSSEDLRSYSESLNSGNEQRLDKDDYSKLWQWIGTKEKAGEDIYERKAKEKWDKKEKRKERMPGEDEREFKKIDQDLKRAIQNTERSGSDIGAFKKGHKQILRETQGRMGDIHSDVTGKLEEQRIKDLIERFPDRAEELGEQLESIKRLNLEDRQSQTPNKWEDFDRLLGEDWKTPEHEKDKKHDQTKTQDSTRAQDPTKTADTSRGQEQTSGERQSIDQAVSTVHDQTAGDKTQELERDDAEQLFERGGM